MNKAPARIAVLSILIICAAGGLPAQSDNVRQTEKEIKSTKSQLERMDVEIETREEEAKGLEKREGSLVRQIRDIERKIDRSRRTLKSLNGEIAEINAEISYINRQLGRLSDKLGRKKAILHRRIREIYKRGRLHTTQVLLESHSFTDFLKRIKYLTLIADQDKRLVREVGQLQDTYGQYRRANERKLAQRIVRKEEIETEQDSLELSEQRRHVLLESVKSKRVGVLEMIEQRRADRQRMAQLIEEMERRRRELIEQARREGRTPPPETAYLAGKMGSLDWPVARGKVVRGFGPYTDEITRTKVINNGLEINAPEGEQVLTVASGSVVMAEWYLAYGKTVMIDHGASMYSIYAHLGEVYVTKGDFVNGRDVIATVGSTGSLEGPMLYFELRDGARPVDPRSWLGRK
ncbi:MAG: peptidoglycan DD-metalloendopeptidase family protein [Candidatus Glassbacteria bacterium]